MMLNSIIHHALEQELHTSFLYTAHQACTPRIRQFTHTHTHCTLHSHKQITTCDINHIQKYNPRTSQTQHPHQPQRTQHTQCTQTHMPPNKHHRHQTLLDVRPPIHTHTHTHHTSYTSPILHTCTPHITIKHNKNTPLTYQTQMTWFALMECAWCVLCVIYACDVCVGRCVWCVRWSMRVMCAVVDRLSDVQIAYNERHARRRRERGRERR